MRYRIICAIDSRDAREIVNFQVFDPLASLSCRSRHGAEGSSEVFYVWEHNDIVDNNRVEIKVGKR